MAKDLSISYLLDFYGQMLTDKQREVTEFYYNDDLSLAEIADHCHITRQGVRDSIKRAEAQLREYEEKLGLDVYKRQLYSRKKRFLCRILYGARHCCISWMEWSRMPPTRNRCRRKQNPPAD